MKENHFGKYDWDNLFHKFRGSKKFIKKNKVLEFFKKSKREQIYYSKHGVQKIVNLLKNQVRVILH